MYHFEAGVMDSCLSISSVHVKGPVQLNGLDSIVFELISKSKQTMMDLDICIKKKKIKSEKVRCTPQSVPFGQTLPLAVARGTELSRDFQR